MTGDLLFTLFFQSCQLFFGRVSFLFSLLPLSEGPTCLPDQAHVEVLPFEAEASGLHDLMPHMPSRTWTAKVVTAIVVLAELLQLV